MDKALSFPFGNADVQALTSGATMAVTVKNSLTVINMTQMAAAGTLNLTLSGQLRVGARIIVKTSADGTNRAFTPGTLMTGQAVSILANKSFALEYFYDGSNFIHIGTVQLN